MILLPQSELKEIAENLDMGMRVFVHKQTKEIVSYPSDDYDFDTEMWEEQMEKANEKDFIEIYKMDSRSGFSVMEDFIETVGDKNLANRLSFALGRPKPFQNFKYELEYDRENLHKWYAFKLERSTDWVKEQLKDR
jgi:hypothetical protein